MPVFSLFSNVSVDKMNAGFLKETSQLIAKLLGKPESYVSVHVVPDQCMLFGGTNDPCAQVTLCSIGAIGGEKNKKLSKAISEHLSKSLNVDADRCYIRFIDLKGSDVGYNGSTF